MALTARWFPIPTTDSTLTGRAACGLRGCCPELATAALFFPGQPSEMWIYVMRSGFVRGEDGAWRLSPRAARQWQRNKREGGSWKDFHPEGRHFHRDLLGLALADPAPRHWIKADGGPGARQMQSFEVQEADLPVRVLCPLCEWVNVIYSARATLGFAQPISAGTKRPVRGR